MCTGDFKVHSSIELVKFSGLSLNINYSGKRIGFIDAWEDDEVKNGIWVEYIYIIKKYHNSGFGSEAMKRAIKSWSELGYEIVSLDDIHWEKSENFWGNLGFEGEEKRKQLVIKKAPWI